MHSSVKFWANYPKLYGNCAFPQNFHTKKLGEITVFYAILPRFVIHDEYCDERWGCFLTVVNGEKSSCIAIKSYILDVYERPGYTSGSEFQNHERKIV